jgi:hypothetical protein
VYVVKKERGKGKSEQRMEKTYLFKPSAKEDGKVQ